MYIDVSYKISLSLAKQFQRRSLNIMAINVYIIAPRWGQTKPWGQNVFQNLNSVYSISPIQMHGRLMLTLP